LRTGLNCPITCSAEREILYIDLPRAERRTMPDERSPELDAQLQSLQDLADQLRVALDALKQKIDAADAAKAAREQQQPPEPTLPE